MKIGWAERSITPHGRKVSLAGQYYERLTEEVDCELMVTAMAVENEGESFVWAVCDLVGITDRLLGAVREEVGEKAPSIKTDNIILSAIHTHNAPFVKYSNILGRSGYYADRPGLMTDTEYHDFIVMRITEAIVEANSKAIDGFGAATVVLNIRTGCCRRGILKNGDGVMYIDTSRPDFLRMEGPDGGPANILYINDESGPRGAVACLPCTSQVLEHQFVMSSDYTGRIRNLLKTEYGDDFFFLPLISPAGDLSPRNLITKDDGLGDMYSPEGAGRFAERIAEGIISSAASPYLKIQDTSVFGIGTVEVNLPGWVPSEEDYRWATDIIKTEKVNFDIADYVQKGVEPYYNQPLALAKKAESIITKFENKDEYEKVDISVTAVRIGDIALVTNPFELFINHGNRITAGAKVGSVWPVQLVNGYKGYFPTPEAVEAGGYSAYIQSVRVDPGPAADKLVDESIKLVDSLFKSP